MHGYIKSQCSEITLKSLNFHLKKIGGISIRLFFGGLFARLFQALFSSSIIVSVSVRAIDFQTNHSDLGAQSFWAKVVTVDCCILIFCGQIIGTSFRWIDLRCRSPSCDCATNCSIFGSDKVDVVERRQLSGVFSAELPYQKSWFYCQFNGNTGRPKKF